ncbi:MAG TPA: DUF502 domain-containing protein [Polyangia bacterium]
MPALRHIPKYFVRGCVALAPVALTAYILYLIFTFADQLLPFRIPGLGVAVAAIVITLVGYLTSNVIGRGVLEVADRILSRLPLVKIIYASLKDLIGAFGDRKSFKQPVSVALVPDKSVRTLGFITREDLTQLGLSQHVAVYLPQAYNFAGNLIIVPRDRVELLAVSASEAMTFIVSGGVSGLQPGKPAPHLGVPVTTAP